MCIKRTIQFVLMFFLTVSWAQAQDGEKVFKQYCWGCHHQTAVAFGPSFQEIANKRTAGEIQGHIIAPESMYKQLGHKRSVMPSFKDALSHEELTTITNFIISFKSKGEK